MTSSFVCERVRLVVAAFYLLACLLQPASSCDDDFIHSHRIFVVQQIMVEWWPRYDFFFKLNFFFINSQSIFVCKKKNYFNQVFIYVLHKINAFGSLVLLRCSLFDTHAYTHTHNCKNRSSTFSVALPLMRIIINGWWWCCIYFIALSPISHSVCVCACFCVTNDCDFIAHCVHQMCSSPLTEEQVRLPHSVLAVVVVSPLTAIFSFNEFYL